MKRIKTFQADIYLGLKEGYDGLEHSTEEVEFFLQEYCDRVGFAFSITPLRFIYKDGNESGFKIGIINYPRFPTLEEDLKSKTIKITEQLLEIFGQKRISIVFSDETVMLEAE